MQIYTCFDVVYFTLAFISIAIWVFYITLARNLDLSLLPEILLEEQAKRQKLPGSKPYDPYESLDYYSDFYFLKKLMQNYTNIVAFNTIFLSVKVFDYFNKSK